MGDHAGGLERSFVAIQRHKSKEFVLNSQVIPN